MKLAAVYQRGPAVLLHALSCTADGVWILSEPCVRMPIDCSDSDMGNALLSVLEWSKSPVPRPTHWKEVLEPLLKAAGVKTWQAFVKSAVCVEVELGGNKLEFIPTRNLGSVGGFQADESRKAVVVPIGASASVGATLRTVLGSAR